MSHCSRALLLLGIVAGGGCIEANLGNSPFYCNNGTPECPEGYVCQAQGKVKLCMLPGVPLPDTQPWPDSMRPDVTPWPDQPPLPPDKYTWPDQPVTKWDKPAADLPPKPKDTGPLPDGIPPHLGCQSNTECGSSSPCCCPMPLIPQVWACLPLCFNPFCLG